MEGEEREREEEREELRERKRSSCLIGTSLSLTSQSEQYRVDEDDERKSRD